MLAIQKTLQHLSKHGSLKGWEDNLIGFEDRQNIVNKKYFDEMDAQYSNEIDE